MNKVKRIFFGVGRRVLWYFFRIFPINPNKIVCVSYYGRGYSDNPKYIVEELRRRHAPYKIYWAVCDSSSILPEGVHPVRFNSASYIFHMCTARLWIDNARKYFHRKRKNQYYIQTWHGGFGLKKIEKDAQDKLPEDYIRCARQDAADTDLMLSNSQTLTRLYREAFWYETGEILTCGLPRNDRLFTYTQEDVRQIRNRLQLPDGVRVCLYAPTFRDNHALDVYDLDYRRLAGALSERFGGRFVILVRLHPNVFKLSDDLQFDQETVFNASFYNDIQELYMISDVAVTDYSSVMFDFMLLDRVCLLYASDVESYRKERDFFIPMESLPFPLAQNNDELENLIRTMDREAYDRQVREFEQRHGFCDRGTASSAVCDWIEQKM